MVCGDDESRALLVLEFKRKRQQRHAKNKRNAPTPCISVLTTYGFANIQLGFDF